MALALYIIVWPFLPGINWWVKHDIPIVSAISTTKINIDTAPTENTLIIPKIDLTKKIIEGPGVDTVNKGIWRRPQTSTPDKGGNTVFAGHRFTYNGQTGFYYLDKLRLNDEIIVFWQAKKYTYKVTDIKEVSPTTIEVEAPTNEPVLTLYTCAPLLTAKNRLVIRARLVQ